MVSVLVVTAWARLMRENGLKAHQKRRFKKTTDSHHNCPVAFNILDLNFACDGPDQKWGADISYIWTAEFGQLRDGSIWPLCWTCSQGVSSVGRPVIG